MAVINDFASNLSPMRRGSHQLVSEPFSASSVISGDPANIIAPASAGFHLLRRVFISGEQNSRFDLESIDVRSEPRHLLWSSLPPPPWPPPLLTLPVEEPVVDPVRAAPADEEEAAAPADGVGNKSVPKAKVPQPRKPRAAPGQPPYIEMITEAIAALKEKTGSSQYAITTYIEDKHKVHLPPTFKKLILVHLRKFTAAGKLTKVKNSFKLPPSAVVYVAFLRLHVVPGCVSSLPDGFLLETLLPGREIPVFRHRSPDVDFLTVDGVDVVLSGIFYSRVIAVYGIGGILTLRRSPIPPPSISPSRSADSGFVPSVLAYSSVLEATVESLTTSPSIASYPHAKNVVDSLYLMDLPPYR